MLGVLKTGLVLAAVRCGEAAMRTPAEVQSADQQPAETAISAAGTVTTAPEVGWVRPGFRALRYDDDFTFLRDPALRTLPLDDLKHISLSEIDPSVYLSLGGELRTRYDSFNQPGFGLRGLARDDFVLQRALLSADLHLGEQLRVFAQGVSGFQFGPESDASPQQDDALDVQQAFVDYRFGESKDQSLTLRAGRMEMAFGSSRLVSVRDPTNVRLNFDGVRAMWRYQGVSVDAFLTRPVEQKRGLFNDGQNDAQTFWGVYSTVPVVPEQRLSADVYYLGLRRENARFDAGKGTDERHSFGTRMFGAAGGWDYDFEAVGQVGRFAQRDIVAWTVASSFGHTWVDAPMKPRLGAKANVASGDTGGDGKFGTFYALFPKQAYFSEISLLAPSNFVDVHPSAQIRPTDTISVVASWDPFWRYTAADGVYGPGRVAIPASASAGRFVGSTADVQMDWAMTPQLSLSVFYAHFFRGAVVRDAGGKDADYFGTWVSFKF